MKDPDVKRIARGFVHGRGRIWNWVGADIRLALLDAEIMDQVLMALMADSTIALDAARLVAWRRELEEVLAAGIPRRGDQPLRFEVYA